MTKPCITHSAGVRPLSSMYALMDLKVLHAVEISTAQGAVVWATPRGEEVTLGILVQILGMQQTTMTAQLLR